MKKKLALFLTGIFAATLLIGCGNSTESNDSNESNEESAGSGVTLTLYGNADDLAKPYMTKIIDLYEAESGNKIDVQGLDTNNAETIALTKFTTGDIPDLYIHFGNSNLLNFNCEENFYDFTEAEWVSDINETVLPQTKVNGKIYGLPFWEASISGCFYNTKIFEDQGLSVPTTQEEFDAICDKLVEVGIQPIYLAASDAWPILYQYAFDPIFSGDDGTKLIEQLNSNTITYSDIPQIKDMLNWFKKAAERGWFGESYMTDTWDYTSEVLGEGKAAMMFCWDTWFDTDFDNDSYTYKKDDFGLMPVFMGTIDDGTFEGPNVNLMMVNKNGENVETALEFIKFMADPYNYNKAFEGIATTPVFKQQTTNTPSIQYNKAKDLIDKLGNASVAQPQIIGFSQTEGGKAIQELMSGNITVDECLKRLDEDRIATLESFKK
ncbi:carbohydrate ABC transporter substrate-binding protein (CUT1 family) [Lachnotalea glycerini]|uniref:Carbohydrate ABC transporter substrate-binding protein (CUT1 family) n=1 Tax=Lachnotalea glycerini TaxID=1763509 RepID=A0A318EM40_9FIRM|nr:ABC transporter substrate-binding protein [Lachnotalea glycerini]PXV89165.1 carbohydrate ABC transporter substrate-binding protein (CUT1 family) [Lachnotalea glycerini]